MKGAGMLVVSLRGVNFGFWSHLGCSEQNATKFSRQKSRLGLHAKKYIKYIFLIRFIYSFRGQKKAWTTPRLVSFRGLIQNFRRACPPVSYGSPPPGS